MRNNKAKNLAWQEKVARFKQARAGPAPHVSGALSTTLLEVSFFA
jgi:hypothetical protein